MPHALLLHGRKGIGKRDLAEDLAQWLLCQAPTEAGPCRSCQACQWFEQGQHPDFKRIEPETGGESEEGADKKGGKLITIKDVRGLGEFLSLVSHQGGWRVVLIQPAELLNMAAANALLKTLEEPPARVLLLLVSHQPRRIPATVLSRCRKRPVPTPDRESARAWLLAQGVNDAHGLLEEAGGAPLTVLECAEPERLSRRERFLAALARPRASELSRLAQEGKDRVEEAWGWLTRWQFDLLAIRAGASPRYFPSYAKGLAQIAPRIDLEALWQAQWDLVAAGRWLRHPLNGQLLLESWLLRYLDTMEAGHGR
ncbi:MAG: DNA polymerase III subunit delta' [Pseudomonadota bacterium]